jgi:hypothetical protein
MQCLLVGLLAVCACDKAHATEARKKVRYQHGARVARVVAEDLERHTAGLRHAADRVGAGFVKVSGEQQEREMRLVLKLLRSPKKGVQELVISPLSFIAAVDKNGMVIARDSDPDHMKGMDLAKMFPTVRDALAGKEGYALGEFASLEPNGKPSVTIIMAAPSHFGGQVVGALALGIPLWRMQQRLSKQLQMEEAGKKQGVVIWTYLYRGDELFSHGTPRDLDQIVPDAKTRKQGLARSPGGFTGEIAQYGYWYGYGVRPLRMLGDDTGVVVFRMDPR